MVSPSHHPESKMSPTGSQSFNSSWNYQALAKAKMTDPPTKKCFSEMFSKEALVIPHGGIMFFPSWLNHWRAHGKGESRAISFPLTVGGTFGNRRCNGHGIGSEDVVKPRCTEG